MICTKYETLRILEGTDLNQLKKEIELLLRQEQKNCCDY